MEGGGTGGEGWKTVVIMMDLGIEMEWKWVKEKLVGTVHS